MNDLTRTILTFWFGEPGADHSPQVKRWFTKDPAFDAEIAERFGDALESAARGELDAWGEGDPKEALALVVLLDQFSRNVFRGTPRSFAQDGRALRVCLGGQERGADRALPFMERYIFFMPMMHSEDLDVQRRSVLAFKALADEAREGGAPEGVQKLLLSAGDYAVQHARIIERFGRFPHRNAIVGRASTAEEVTFLAEPGSSF